MRSTIVPTPRRRQAVAQPQPALQQPQNGDGQERPAEQRGQQIKTDEHHHRVRHMLRSVDCKPSGPPSSSNAVAIPASASAVNHPVKSPGGYQTTVPSLPGRANSAWRTKSATGTAFTAAKTAAPKRSLAANRTSAPVRPASTAAPAPSHSPARNSGSWVI